MSPILPMITRHMMRIVIGLEHLALPAQLGELILILTRTIPLRPRVNMQSSELAKRQDQ
jgi:hypothetical protein